MRANFSHSLHAKLIAGFRASVRTCRRQRPAVVTHALRRHCLDVAIVMPRVQLVLKMELYAHILAADRSSHLICSIFPR